MIALETKIATLEQKVQELEAALKDRPPPAPQPSGQTQP